jgi:hypothetical protein
MGKKLEHKRNYIFIQRWIKSGNMHNIMERQRERDSWRQEWFMKAGVKRETRGGGGRRGLR